MLLGFIHVSTVTDVNMSQPWHKTKEAQLTLLEVVVTDRCQLLSMKNAWELMRPLGILDRKAANHAYVQRFRFASCFQVKLLSSEVWQMMGSTINKGQESSKNRLCLEETLQQSSTESFKKNIPNESNEKGICLAWLLAWICGNESGRGPPSLKRLKTPQSSFDSFGYVRLGSSAESRFSWRQPMVTGTKTKEAGTAAKVKAAL